MNGTGGHFPLEFIANPMAKHRGSNWSNDGDSVVFNARVARKAQCEDHFFACVQVTKAGLEFMVMTSGGTSIGVTTRA